VSEVYVVEYVKVSTPYKPGDQVPFMRRDRAESLVSRGIATPVNWDPEEIEMEPKTLEQIDPEGITVQSQSAGSSKAPDAPLNDKQIHKPWKNPLRPIRK
jgi:hypothetical protein